ncbi:Spy/CpxP family protein refolding chaperone [Gemmatimonadota bacterium]
MTTFLRRNLATLILAASVGLNVTLAVILLSQPDPHERMRRYYQEGSWRGDDFRRADIDQRRGAMPDSMRQNVPSFEPEQLEAMRALRRTMFTEIEPARQEINTLQRLIREELRNDEPDTARIDSMTTRIMRQQNQIQQRTLRLILAERDILTPEQYQMFLRYMVPGQLGQMDQLYDYGRRDRSGGDGRGRRDSLDTNRSGSGRSGGQPPPPPYH